MAESNVHRFNLARFLAKIAHFTLLTIPTFHLYSLIQITPLCVYPWNTMQTQTDRQTNKPASPLDTLVRVALLSIQTSIVSDVTEAVVHQSSVASPVSVSCRGFGQRSSCVIHTLRKPILNYKKGKYWEIIPDEQSTSCCSERETRLPVFLNHCPSTPPVVAKA